MTSAFVHALLIFNVAASSLASSAPCKITDGSAENKVSCSCGGTTCKSSGMLCNTTSPKIYDDWRLGCEDVHVSFVGAGPTFADFIFD
jgi:hypothetical protein